MFTYYNYNFPHHITLDDEGTSIHWFWYYSAISQICEDCDGLIEFKMGDEVD